MYLAKKKLRDAFVTAEAGRSERGRGPSGLSQASGNPPHERSSRCHFLHHQEMCNDAVEELPLSDRDEINNPDARTLEGNNP